MADKPININPDPIAITLSLKQWTTIIETLESYAESANWLLDRSARLQDALGGIRGQLTNKNSRDMH